MKVIILIQQLDTKIGACVGYDFQGCLKFMQ